MTAPRPRPVAMDAVGGEPSTEADDRRYGIRDAAMLLGALAAFAVAAVSVPLQSRLADGVVLGLHVLIVVAVSVLAGRAAGAPTACMAGFAFDFFHVEPIRILHLPTLSGLVVALIVLALLAGRLRQT